MKKKLPQTTQRELDASIREIMGEWIMDHNSERANRRIRGLLRRRSAARVRKSVEAYIDRLRIADLLLEQQFPTAGRGHSEASHQPTSQLESAPCK